MEEIKRKFRSFDFFVECTDERQLNIYICVYNKNTNIAMSTYVLNHILPIYIQMIRLELPLNN